MGLAIPLMKTEEDWLIGLEKNARIEALDSIFSAEKNELYAKNSMISEKIKCHKWKWQ